MPNMGLFDVAGRAGAAQRPHFPLASRMRGTTAWIKLAFDSHSPYVDTQPLAQAGVAEAREYKAMGVLNDEEIGVESDLVSQTVGE